MLLDFQNLIKKYELRINGAIHIGAHHGQEFEAYANAGITNCIFFEPLKKNFEALTRHVGDRAILVNKALGSETKQIEMFVESANRGMSSSILTPKLHTQQYPHIVFNEKELVEMIRLDDFPMDAEKYNFISIDVQGYELHVFKGAEKTLQTIDYIFSEVNRDELYEGCADVTALDEYLGSFGFNRVETSWAGGTWGDAFYLKK
jgi:hypothetical protein